MARGSATWPVAGILTGVLMLAGGAVPASAQHGRPGGAMRMEERLGLSDDQMRALHQAREQRWDARRQFRRSLMTARRALNEAILQGGDDAAIQAKKTEVQQLVAQGLDLRIQAMRDFARILTPEQRTRLLRQRPSRSERELPTAG